MLVKDREAFINGLKDGLPISLGYLAVSFALGIAAKNSGLLWTEALVMSLLNNTSAGEFAALELFKANIPYLELALTQVIINLRYLLMSCALSQKIAPSTSLPKRLLLGFDITDEIFGISIAQKGTLNVYYSYGAMAISIPGWAIGTSLGVIVGNILPLSVVSALSVALYGMFIAIIIPPATKSKIMAIVIIISMTTSYLWDYIPCLNKVGSGTKIIILTTIISLISAILYPVKEDEHA